MKFPDSPKGMTGIEALKTSLELAEIALRIPSPSPSEELLLRTIRFMGAAMLIVARDGIMQDDGAQGVKSLKGEW